MANQRKPQSTPQARSQSKPQTNPRRNPRRKPEQAAPAAVSPTGKASARTDLGNEWRSQTGDFLTTSFGTRLPDADHSLKAGSRGPTLLEDFAFREKMTHFDHERIPERVVHARGAGAHGVFQAYGSASSGLS